MKRFVTLCIVMLLVTVAGAQMLPEEFIGDYLEPVGPVDIEAILTDFHAPYSMPDGNSFVSFGELYVENDIATIQVHTIARRICFGGSFCVATSPMPVNIVSSLPWDDAGLFIWMWDSSYHPLFDALTVDVSGVLPHAYWRTGRFNLIDGAWVVHPYATYSEYMVMKRTTPIVPYMPYVSALAGF